LLGKKRVCKLKSDFIAFDLPFIRKVNKLIFKKTAIMGIAIKK